MDAALGQQPRHLAAVLAGSWRPADWQGAAQPARGGQAVAGTEIPAGARRGAAIRRGGHHWLLRDHRHGTAFPAARCRGGRLPGGRGAGDPPGDGRARRAPVDPGERRGCRVVSVSGDARGSPAAPPAPATTATTVLTGVVAHPGGRHPVALLGQPHAILVCSGVPGHAGRAAGAAEAGPTAGVGTVAPSNARARGRCYEPTELVAETTMISPGSSVRLRNAWGIPDGRYAKPPSSR